MYAYVHANLHAHARNRTHTHSNICTYTRTHTDAHTHTLRTARTHKHTFGRTARSRADTAKVPFTLAQRPRGDYPQRHHKHQQHRAGAYCHQSFQDEPDTHQYNDNYGFVLILRVARWFRNKFSYVCMCSCDRKAVTEVITATDNSKETPNVLDLFRVLRSRLIRIHFCTIFVCP